MGYCPNCGRATRDGTNRCAGCGAPLTGARPAVPPLSPVPPPPAVCGDAKRPLARPVVVIAIVAIALAVIAAGVGVGVTVLHGTDARSAPAVVDENPPVEVPVPDDPVPDDGTVRPTGCDSLEEMAGMYVDAEFGGDVDSYIRIMLPQIYDRYMEEYTPEEFADALARNLSYYSGGTLSYTYTMDEPDPYSEKAFRTEHDLLMDTYNGEVDIDDAAEVTADVDFTYEGGIDLSQNASFLAVHVNGKWYLVENRF